MKKVWILTIVVVALGIFAGDINIYFSLKKQMKTEIASALEKCKAEMLLASDLKQQASEKENRLTIRMGRFVASHAPTGEALVKALDLELTKRAIAIDSSAECGIEGICQGVTVEFSIRDKAGNAIKVWSWTDSAAWVNFSPEKAAIEIANAVQGYIASRGGVK